MSDFGANIFDDRNPAPEPKRPRKRGRAAPAAEAPVAPVAPVEPVAPVAPIEPPRVEEVPLKQPDWVHDDATTVVFAVPVAPAKAPAAEEPRTVAPEAAPETAPRQPAPERTDAPRRDERRGDHSRTGPHGRDRFRRDRDDGDDRSTPPRERPAPAGPQPSPAAAPARPTHQIAILVDLLALQAEARGQGGELALHRLRTAMAGDRKCRKAVCYATRGSTPPHGFELRSNEDNVGGIGIAAAALELLADGALLALAPPTPAIRQLAAALRKAGHEVELAGFGATDGDNPPMRRLGRECLFVP
jgi:hypothetical protein